MTIILAIESSCDDTSAAIVDDKKNILAQIVINQNLEHSPYLGVVPEIAARSHMSNLENCINYVLDKADLKLEDIDAFASTSGPGLIGGIIVGTMFAKALSSTQNKPFIAINHLEGHSLTARLCYDIQYPYLLLLISGGHCQFIIVESLARYHIIGETLDDALGEAFDKTAKMLGFGYPGGPRLEKEAASGDELKYKLPLAMYGRNGCDMSFSGIKTAVRTLITKLNAPLTDEQKSDISASFQYTVTEILLERASRASKIYSESFSNKQFVIAGGVAANNYIRSKLKIRFEELGFQMFVPPAKLCTDNAAMIAWAAQERFAASKFNDLAFCPRARWNLNELD